MAGIGLIEVVWLGVMLFVVVFVLIPFFQQVRRRRLERAEDEDGRPCANCGYDLRGVHHARCPECGRPVDAATTAAVPSWSADFDVAKLREDFPHTPIDPLAPQPWEPTAQVYSTQDGWLADLLVEQLNARGVWCTVRRHGQEEVTGAYAVTVEYHRLVVPEAEKERAEAILDRFRIRAGTSQD